MHNEDIYHPWSDTRPGSRNPKNEVTISDDIMIKDMVWAGNGPVPNLEDNAFWDKKISDLDENIKQVKAGCVHPQFTPDELRTLEALEQQPEHLFFFAVLRRRRRTRTNKNVVFNIMFSLAALGRPGQWILHHEDLYHPCIDTRPNTRDPSNVVTIRGEPFDGVMVGIKKRLDLPAARELLWGRRATTRP